MVKQPQVIHTDVGRFFPYAVAATTTVLLLPFVAIAGLLWLSDPDPSRFATSGTGVAISLLTTVVGTAIWIRRPGSGELSFGDLMLWSWVKRRAVEKKLLRGTSCLGLDRSGRPLGEATVSLDEQLKALYHLSHALESKDPYTHGHSRRVERHAYRLGMTMGLSTKEMEDLRAAAALHDVGKVRVPDSILRKPGRLTDEERRVMELHPVVGESMVFPVTNPVVIRAVRHHHEHWNGKGYPDGLSGTEIPMAARIICVADSYDAMTSTRPYRAGMARKTAERILRDESGEQFDPKVIDAFFAARTSPLPVPIGGLFAFLGRPERAMREVALWLKRAGGASLAPAAGAAGTAAIVTASLFGAPAIRATGTDGSARARTVATQATVVVPAEAVPAVARRAQVPSMTEELRLTRAAVAAPSASRVLGELVFNPNSDGSPAEEASGPGDPSDPPPSDPPPGEPPVVDPPIVDPPPVVDPPVVVPPGIEPPEKEPRTRHTPGTDPRPDRGKDCPGSGRRSVDRCHPAP